jgi:cytidine deaminase
MYKILTEAEIIKFLKMALEAAFFSYSPYSHFRVGAILLCEDGSFLKGTNVENRSYGLTICAERTALGNALSQGKKKFRALFLASPDAQHPVPPCGACRQVLSEFVNKKFPIYYCAKNLKYLMQTIGELYPLDSLQELKNL